jgi:hypothetical protein
MSELLTIATLLPRAEEAWEPVLFGGLIPIIGALAVLIIIVKAVRANDETEELQPPAPTPKADEGTPPPPRQPGGTT